MSDPNTDAPVDPVDPFAPVAPREDSHVVLGGTTLRVIGWVWIALLPVSILLGQVGEAALVAALALFIALGMLLALAPAVIVVRYWLQHDRTPLPRRLWRAGIGSGLASAVLGAFVAFLGLVIDLRIMVALSVVFSVAGLGIAAVMLISAKRGDVGESIRVSQSHFAAATVLSLLIVIAVPKFACGCGDKSKAYRAEMKSDLRNLLYVEESFFADSGRYAAQLPAPLYFPSSGVTAPAITLEGSRGWTATVSHINLPGETCGIAVGAPNPVDASADSAMPVCHSR